MKKIIYIFILTCFSCANNFEQIDLVGKWYRFEQSGPVPVGFMSIEFKKDTIITNSPFFSVKGVWTKSNNKILIRNFSQGNKMTELKLSMPTKGSLVIEEKAGQNWGAEFRKSQEFLTFFNNSKGVELPKNNNSTLSKTKWNRVFNIYFTEKEGFPRISSDFSNEIESMKLDFEKFRGSHPAEFYNELKILLFADKDFPKKKVERIIAELNKNYSNPIYLVYNTLIPDCSEEGTFWLTQKIN